MAFESEFYTMFAHVVELQLWDGTYDRFGIPNHSAEVLAFPARISGKKLGERRPMTEGDNQDVFDIWFHDPDNHTYTINDKVILPSDDAAFAQGRFPTIYAVVRVTDDDGQHHVKIQCGWQYHRQGQ